MSEATTLRPGELEWHLTRDASTHPLFTVRVMHVATGIYAESDENRNQFKAREQALQRLQAKLEARQSVGVGAISDPIPDRFAPARWRP